MRSFAKLVIMLTLSLSLFACGPVYRTITHYDSPPSEAGKRCVMQCETHRKQCKDDCNMRYDACVYDAEARGREEFLDAKEDYLDRKARCLERGKKDCDSLQEPRLRDFTRDSNCRSACDCDSDFDRCFQVCGGGIRYERQCVSGCE